MKLRTYYRVKADKAGLPIYKKLSVGYYEQIDELIKNEILTEAEVFKTGIKFTCFNKIKVPSNSVYWFFGARFSDN